MPPNAVQPRPLTGSDTKKIYSWKDVAKHNTEKSCWIYIDSTVYDITSWLDKHPGGKEHLLLAAGRDCTDLFTSYHPFTDKPRAMLSNYAVGSIVDKEYPQYTPDTGFYKEVCRRVNEYFVKNHINYKSAVPGLTRLFFFLLTAAISFPAMYTSTLPVVVRIVAAIAFGVSQALCLLHCMHDASHTSIGNHPLMWKLVGRLTMDFVAGASLTSWHNQHVIGHHVYTNVMGADPDLPVSRTGDLRRVVHFQKWEWFYKFQAYYLMFLYGFLGIKFRIQDIEGILTASNGPIRVNIVDHSEHIYQAFIKLQWLCWRILYPIFVWQVPFGEYFLYFMIAELMTGWFLAFNFQVSHVSPSAVFPDITSSFNDEWAVSQVKTTVDYAHGDWIATLLCGALNYQTVHHLFPGVSQYQYPAIAPIIRQVCKEYNVPFTHIDTFREALGLHVQYLQEMGRKSDM